MKKLVQAIQSHHKILKHPAMFAVAAFSAHSFAQQSQVEEVLVLGKSATYGNSLVTESMVNQQSSLTSINALIDNLPGVTVNEGDTYGFDDWSTAITVRGFSTNLSEQQVGTTIDGIPNGNSNYGGGSKANRFIDPANLGGIEVSQGTADIASRSHEALGGTVNYLTDNPLDEQRFRIEGSLGEYDAKRYYLRYDTGNFGADNQAWVAYSYQEATDWVGESAENERDHFAAKLVSNLDIAKLTAYVAYDDIHEDNYQRIYSEAQFDNLPYEDGLTADWTGVPAEDQLFRQGWSTLRENLLGYVKADFDFTPELSVSTSIYYHENEGRGDWLPPYLVNVTADASGESEFLGGTTAQTGNVDASDRIFFVDAAGNALTPDPNCVPTYTIENWYGVPSYTVAQHEDPSCYPDGAIAVMSYRNTHYEKDRTGFNVDLDWTTEIAGHNNQLRVGLWYEDQTRDEWRDWHNVTGVNAQFDSTPYWVQYNRSYPQETTKWYIEDSLTTGALTWTLGAKKFLVDVEREDLFGESSSIAINSDSDVLFSGGVVWQTDVDGLEVFAGYAENFKALSDLILERPDSNLSSIEPETSTTAELGLRYNARDLEISAAIYQNEFDNRLIFLSNDTVAGPDFTIGTNGSYFNAGGIDSNGLEMAVDYTFNPAFNFYAAYTYSDATYAGTGDSAVDAAQGIVSGNEVAGIPEHQFVVSLNWTGEQMNAGISNKYTGERQVNTLNSWQADSYNVVDAYIGANLQSIGFGEAVRLNLVVNNLLDEEYLGTIASNAAWLGAPRTVSLSAAIDF